MRHPQATLWATAVAVASISLGGCSSDLPSSNSSEVSESQAELTDAAKSRMLERLGRGLARALKDPAVRAWVSSEVVSSPYVEYRVPIRDKVLNEPNRSELRTLGREAALTAADLTLLRRFPHLELYLPLDDQRASWRGGADVQVAVRRPSEDYVLFRLDGSTAVVSADHMPTTPTLVLAVSEIDYTDRESAVRGGRNTGEHMRAPSPFAAPAERRPTYSALSTMMVDISQWTRSRRQQIHQPQDGGLSGDDEMEIYGSINGGYGECRRYTGLDEDVIYVRSYPTTPLSLAEAIAVAVPSDGGTPLYVKAFEDDDDACVQRAADDFYGEWFYPRNPFNNNYNVLQQLRISPTNSNGYASIEVTEYVNGQPDP